MVKHVIIWKLKETDTDSRTNIKQGIKDGLEGLKGNIPGLVDIKVNINPLASSNADLILDSTFENEISLNNYTVNPLHVEVAVNKVRPFVETRMCYDYEI